jgi:hypothetical protein
MKKLSIAIDMGAKNTGVFVVKSKNDKIVEKKAFTVILGKNALNFSKISRRNNRHRVRNQKRRKLAKRLLWEILDKNSFDNKQIESIQGLLNRRGYIFLSSDLEFEIDDKLLDFFENDEELRSFTSKNEFLEYFSELEDEAVEKIDDFIDKIPPKKFKSFKDFLLSIKREIQTGSKPRKNYLKEIKTEIEEYNFIKNREKFYNLIGNISNLQLRLLRKYFNQKFDDKFDDKKLYKKLNDYFKRFHNKEFEENLLPKFNKFNSSKEFLENCNPELTIPPYEDMNNRGTYKCNSLLIKDELADKLQNSINKLLNTEYFEILKEENLSNSQLLQRILDINSKFIDKDIYPRNLFKYHKGDFNWYKNILGNDYTAFSQFAKKYFEEETEIINGIYKKDSIFKKCNLNTPYKNNIKEILLKPVYNYEFTPKEAEEFRKYIENYGKIHGNLTLLGFFRKTYDDYKKYQNSFYTLILDEYEKQQTKEIKSFYKNIDKVLEILNKFRDFKFNSQKENIKRVANIIIQTYSILFKEIKGFNKTCKHCTIENSKRSKEENPIAKRILSDVSKPIDGMLDMVLDRIAFEISEEIDVDNIDELEIILEQNKFKFEENLADIKGKKVKKREDNDLLKSEICPYTGEKIKDGEYDHILPRSKELFNSKANLIYCSSKGNREKLNKSYTIENLSSKHLKDIFKTDNMESIKKFIEENINNIDENTYTNFDNLSLKEQKAFRYALFFNHNSSVFKKAKQLLVKDKIKLYSNGTQKRFARLIYEKLGINIPVKVKLVDSREVSATRFELSYNSKTGEVNEILKETIQKPHSHSIDAMVVFYLSHNFEWDEIYLTKSNIKNISKRKPLIQAGNDIKSFQLFQDSIYKENYKHISKDDKNIDKLLKYEILYQNKNSQKESVYSKEEIKDIVKVDVNKLSSLLFKLFETKDEKSLTELKVLDKYRFNTIKDDIKNIFYDKKGKLISYKEFLALKQPIYMEKTYKAVYSKLKEIEENNLDYEQEMSKFFKLGNRKRGKKRHIFSISKNGQNAKFRIRRNGQFVVLGGENLATKTYLIGNSLKSIPFFSKNVLPLKIEDVVKCLELTDKAQHIYEVKIDITEIEEYVKQLVYYVAEASRIIVEVTFKKNIFEFDKIEEFNGKKDEKFREFLEKYIQNRKLKLFEYIGSIRDSLNGSAVVLENSDDIIKLRYRSEISSRKKEIILKNLK